MSSAATTIIDSSARDSPTVENGSGMKKANKSDDDFDLLPHYDFSKMRRVAPPRRLQEGERVYINDAPFIVRGHGFVPDPAGKQSDNGTSPRKKR